MVHALSGFFRKQYGCVKKIYDDPTMDKVLGIGLESIDEESEPVDVEADDPIQLEAQDVITMANRKVCPVQVVPAASKESPVKVNTKDSTVVDEKVKNLMDTLTGLNINYNRIKRVSTGLVEVDLATPDGTMFSTISVDVDDKIYGIGGLITFIGKVPAVTEYNHKPFILNNETLKSIMNNKPIASKYYVPDNLVILNKWVDMTTLKETDKEKREQVLAKTGKAIEKMNEDIIKAANGQPFRFVFAKYKSPNEFSLVSSNRNTLSNLSDEKLLTTKELWLNIKDESVTLDYDPNK